MKAIIKEINNRYFAILENGDEIEIDDSDISKNNLKVGQEIEGEIILDERNIQYNDGAYSRSYYEYERFIIKKI
jgi:hypothetical protein